MNSSCALISTNGHHGMTTVRDMVDAPILGRRGAAVESRCLSVAGRGIPGDPASTIHSAIPAEFVSRNFSDTF